MVKPGDTVVAIHGQREECPGRGQKISGLNPPPPVSHILVVLRAVALRYSSAAVCFSTLISLGMLKKHTASSRRNGMMP